MKPAQRIVKNILASGVSGVVGGLIQLAAIVLVARNVSVAEFGVYSFILAFAMFVWLLADSGLSTILVRELATQPEKTAEILGAGLALIWILSVVGELLILAVVPFLHLSFTDKILMAVMGVATLTQLHCIGYASALRAREENEIQALGYVLHKILFIIIIYVGLKSGLALVGVVAAHLFPGLFLWAFYRWIVIRRCGHPHFKWEVARWKYLLTHSLPVGGATVFRMVAEQADVLILQLLSDLRTVGLFSGPYRISMATRQIAQILTYPLYPMYSRLAGEEGPRLPFLEAYQRSVKFFLVIAFPIAGVFIISSEKLLTLLLGPAYLPAIPAMQFLGLGFVPLFLSSAFPLLLTALHEQRFLLRTSALGLGLRIGLNFALVPVCGFLGPCISFVVGEITMVALWIYRLRQLGFPLEIGALLWRLAAASACLAAVLYPFKSQSLLLFVPAATASVLIYAAIVWKLGTFTSTDLVLAKEGISFLQRFLDQRRSSAAPPP